MKWLCGSLSNSRFIVSREQSNAHHGPARLLINAFAIPAGKYGEMNAVTQIRPSAGIDAFHRERSRFIDSFAGAEAAVVKLLKANGEKLPSAKEPFAQLLQTLQKLAPGPQLSREKKKLLDEFAVQIGELLAVRADIVHGQMEMAEVSGETHARFVNAREIGKPFPSCRMLSFDQFRELTRQVETLAGKLASS